MKSSIVALVIVLTACATAGTTSGARVSRDVITRAEIEQSGAQDAYRLVQNLRPQWLRSRGIKSAQSAGETVRVYVDDAPMGQVEALQQISLGGVQLVRFLSPAAANLRWGTGHVNGAIVISTQDPGGR